MDINNKHGNRFKRNTPIDGVSARPSVRFNQGGSSNRFDNRGRGTVAQRGKDQPSLLNDFKRPDGFHATRQQEIRQNSSPSHIRQETVIIDRKKAKKSAKKGLFGRRKSPNDHSSSKKKPLTKKQKILRISAIVVVVLMIILGVMFAKGFITLKKLFPGGGGAAALQQNVDPSQLRGEGDGRVNILLLGRGGEGHEGPDLTDTIIIASIDPIAKEAALVSIPRDLYVRVDEVGSMKINSVFYTGKTGFNPTGERMNDQMTKQAEEAGFKMLERTIETTLGLPIHYHIMVDFEGFEQAINTVGGVTVNVPKAVYDPLRIDGQQYILDVQPGVQDMDGFKALAYARSRYTSPRGDFDRAERQRLIINALKDKILSAGTFGNPQKITELMDTFGNHVQTNFSIQDLQRLYQLSQEIPADKIGSIGLSDPPNNYVTTGNIGGLSVVLPTAGEGDYSDIQYFLRNALKDSYLKDENATIMVLNGTTRNGFATEKGEELKSYGYTVSEIGNAPTKTYQQTLIVDLKSGENKFTQNYLEKRFGVTAVNALPDPAIVPGTADFVIILGSDQAAN